MLCPGTVHPALPPAAAGASEQKADSGSAVASVGAATEASAPLWVMQDVRLGGILSYNLRRDMTEQQSRTQQGLNATLRAATNTFIWQPWFARVDGAFGLTMSRDSSDGAVGSGNNTSKNVFLTGSGQLSALPLSKFPFEAHFERSDSRVSTDLALANGYASQRYGFTQHYIRPEGDSMIGWDRSTQTSADSGSDQQDSLLLNMSHSIENHRLQLTGNRTDNTHEISGEQAVQNNLSLQHSYAPDPAISVESMANISRSNFHLLQGDNDTRLVQLSSLAFWRPDNKPITVTGGVRLFALESDTSGFGISVDGARVRNANANLGVNYDLTRFTRLNAGVNVNQVDSNGVKSTNTSQTVGASYQPDTIEFGEYRYGWSTSGNISNQTGGQDAVRQLSLQLSHNLSRSFTLNGGSTISVEGSQSLAAIMGNSVSDSSELANESASSKQLTHSGSISWDLSRETGAALLRLSASDSREFGGEQNFFQLINFQASSNLPTGDYSSWTGNLTVQAVRQSTNPIVSNTDLINQQNNTNSNDGFVTTSSGSINYQNQRMFGVRRLRFVSDLRLNSQALLPLLGSAADQETAAWENRFDYVIGLTRLRLSMLISKSSSGLGGSGENASNINKSIMFSVSRSFGVF